MLAVFLQEVTGYVESSRSFSANKVLTSNPTSSSHIPSGACDHAEILTTMNCFEKIWANIKSTRFDIFPLHLV